MIKVCYAGVEAMTSFALFIVDGTPVGDLTFFGPEFQISPAVCDVNRSYYWTILVPTTEYVFL